MRTSELLVGIGLLGFAFGLSPAVSFDGSRAPEGTTVAAPGADGRPGTDAAGNALGNATPLAAVPGAPLTTMPPRSGLPTSPQEAFRSGTQALRQGKTEPAGMELEYADERGVAAALWKVGGK